ncbi:MAG: hypothetical protein AAFS02_01635 [Pseudomonadota bacterium]
MLSLKRTVSTWETLRVAGTTPFARAAVAVPVLGYFILFGESANTYFRLTLDAELSLWRVYWLYFGFTVVALAQVLFNWYCPPEIKQHGTGYEFAAREERTINPDRINKMQELLIAQAYAKVRSDSDPDFQRAREFEHDPKQGLPSDHYAVKLNHARADVRGLDLPQIMARYVDAIDVQKPATRLIVTYLYATGLALVLVPTLATLGQVILSAWEKIVPLFQ